MWQMVGSLGGMRVVAVSAVVIVTILGRVSYMSDLAETAQVAAKSTFASTPDRCVLIDSSDDVVQETQHPGEASMHYPRVVLYAPCVLSKYRNIAYEYFNSASAWYFVRTATLERLEIKHYGENPIALEGSKMRQTTMMNFLMQNIMPQFGLLSPKSYDFYLDWDVGLVWGLFDSASLGGIEAVSAKYRPIMLDVAEQLKAYTNPRGEQAYALTYMDTEANRHWIESELGVIPMPAVVVQKKAGDGLYFVYNGKLTSSAIAQFIKDVDDGCVGYDVRFGRAGWRQKPTFQCEVLASQQAFSIEELDLSS